MIAFASAFPDTLTLVSSTVQDDPRRWIIRTDDGVSVFITDAQADELEAQLAARRAKPARKAA